MSLVDTLIAPSNPRSKWGWRLRRQSHAVRRLVFTREPGWQFSLMLALQGIFLFIAIPALSAGEADRSLSMILQLALAAIAIFLVAQSVAVRTILAVSLCLTLAARLLPGVIPQTTTLLTVFAYNLLLTAVMARAVFGPGEVNHHRIAGAIYIYLNVVVLFALVFSGLVLLVPQALSNFPVGTAHRTATLLHYSFTTFTAIGDNQIVPNCAAARSLSDLETIIGHLFPAILLSRLVGLHLSKETRVEASCPKSDRGN